MVQKEQSGQSLGQPDFYVKGHTALLKFLLICLPLWLSFKFYSGPYEEFVHIHLACIVYLIIWSLIIQMIFPQAQERLLLIILFFLFCIIELAAWQIPSLFENISLIMRDHQIIGGHFSLHKIPYYGVGAFIGFFILRACRIR
jgi:hypothetical protein